MPPSKLTSDHSKPAPSTVTALTKLKTGRIDRRWSLAKAGLLAGARHAVRTASGWLLPTQQRQVYCQQSLTREAVYFIQELSKLKGSVVKVGQMMALWGDSFFSPEITQALHDLENQTAMMDWPSIHQQLLQELGPVKLCEFSVATVAIGCASLAQVHRATHLVDNAQWCFKVQYPGIADSIESDMASFAHLLYVARLVPRTRDFEQWFDAIKTILKQEVDYRQELLATQRFKKYLASNASYRIPDVYPDYSSSRVLACSFEEGAQLNSDVVLQLSQERRNRLGELCLHLFWQEIWHWGEMQTDPNFGNYLVRSDSETQQDILILLDFGAVYRFDPLVLKAGQNLIRNLFTQNKSGVIQALFELHFLNDQSPEAVVADLYQLMNIAMEPFCENHPYDWAASNLTARMINQVTKSAFSQYFKVPPKDLLFVSRKIMGAFSLLATLGAHINGYVLLSGYLDEESAVTLP